MLLGVWLVGHQPAAHGVTDQTGLVGLQLLLRKLAVTGTVMHVTAHPDDENNALMAMQSHGEGLRVVLATATRGGGGQNEIGPELFEALGVLRTEELHAAHRFDGAEQRFARAIDFGYTFSVEETFQKWGKEEILGDYVRLIRMTRPDVMITMRPDLPGGGQHHQASAFIGLEAFRAAADPHRFPEQLTDGLRPWQPSKIYKVGYYGFFPGEPKPAPDVHLVPVDGDVYDPLLGRTYAEIGSQARAMHKCQGFGQLLALPGPWIVRYQLADTVIPGQKDTGETSLLAGVDVSVNALARFAGAAPPHSLVAQLDVIAGAVKDATARSLQGGAEAALDPLAHGLAATRALRTWLTSSTLDETARYEIDFRLARTESLFADALVMAQGLRLEALADDGVVTAGQPIKLTAIASSRGPQPVTFRGISVSGLAPGRCSADELRPSPLVTCELAAQVPASAEVTAPYWRRDGTAERYVVDEDVPFGLPFRPTPFRARFELTIAGADVSVDMPIEHRYEGNIFSGEKRTELLVVPALSVTASPEIAIVPTGSAEGLEEPRNVQVTVTSNAPGTVEADVTLEIPPAWRVEPESHHVRFERQDEAATVRFAVYPPQGLAEGQQRITAVASSAGQKWTRGFDVIEYPHTRRRHIYAPAATAIKAIDVAVPANLSVGYVMGVGDQVPQAIEQLGAQVRMLTPSDLAAGDLSVYDAIVTGVRAYERRSDLRAYNHRLLQYAEEGGTVLVQYNKFEFNQAQYGPFPAKVSSRRVTDETSPVTVLAPTHPVFNTPNRITERAWQGWVQERGLYFLGDRDDRYQDLIELVDPFPDNAGPKRGALVEARVGRGRWIYIGLGLWRQLPAGTNGAYRLLANLISLGAEPKRAH